MAIFAALLAPVVATAASLAAPAFLGLLAAANGAALPPRLIGIKQIEDCCLCVIEAAGHLGVNTVYTDCCPLRGDEVMIPDPWLRGSGPGYQPTR